MSNIFCNSVTFGLIKNGLNSSKSMKLGISISKINLIFLHFIKLIICANCFNSAIPMSIKISSCLSFFNLFKIVANLVFAIFALGPFSSKVWFWP
ncbi:hypothetical protein MFC_01403 [Mesomycoplasma flocculare ATCC 27716]|nr:hypothetical protein MFC_01403 [Mesomycoplasma flocculare ATCC 27716]